jgi:transcriptional regulator with XRE-family HTH domain
MEGDHMSRGFNTTTALGRAMLAAGWTASDFSARTGINSRTLTEYLSGRRIMLREHLWAAADALGVEPAEIDEGPADVQ